MMKNGGRMRVLVRQQLEHMAAMPRRWPLLLLACVLLLSSPRGRCDDGLLDAGAWSHAPLWPAPQRARAGSDRVSVSLSLKLRCGGRSCSPILQGALERYQAWIFFAESEPRQPAGVQLLALNVSADAATDLALEQDEGYSLLISAAADDGVTPTATIHAATEWGALRGLETFSQLVQWDRASTSYFIADTPLEINDEPRFAWRQLLIDSARHFLPVPTITRTIDAMAFNKLNVLKWHLSDDQSFPLVSKTFPLLAEKGAWAPEATYSADDVRQVVAYARDRGIRVVPTIDSPAHAASWAKGYPELGAKCHHLDPETGLVLDATSEHVYGFLRQLLAEVSALFPDQYFDLGGDEVHYDCWKADPAVGSWMAAHNMTDDYVQLNGYYEDRAQMIARDLGKQPILHEESFDKNFTLHPGTVIRVWSSPQATLLKVVRSGRRALFNYGWYLDQQSPGGYSTYGFESTWIGMCVPAAVNQQSACLTSPSYP
jgi:hexosaminidase